MIVEGLVRMSREMGLTLIGEGVETEAELIALRRLGVRYLQGFAIARPAFEALPPYAIPDAAIPVLQASA